MRVSSQIEGPANLVRVMKLQAAIKYAEDDMKACVEYVERSPTDDAGMEINKACILFKEQKYEQSLERFKKAQQILGAKPNISYNIAVCYFKLRQYDNSLKHIADIIEKGMFHK